MNSKAIPANVFDIPRIKNKAIVVFMMIVRMEVSMLI
jgi:hypothetical protein